MVAKLTVIFFIILCLLLGFSLTLLPWFSLGAIRDYWGDNFLLLFVADKIGFPALQSAVSSTWFRGAVTGLGVVNLIIAFWEIANFNKSVEYFEGNGQNEK